MTTKTMSVTGRLIETFAAGWAAIQKRHADVPDVVITLASGTEQKARARHGHFQAATWVSGATENVAELFVSGEGLRRSPREVFGTLLHEAAHGVAHTREVQDTSRQGRYHNKKFRDVATELGLDVAEDSKFGWSATSVGDGVAKIYARQIEAIERALVAYRRAEVHPEKEKKTNTATLAMCDCLEPRKIRVAKSTLEAGPIICGVCDEPFTAESE